MNYRYIEFYSKEKPYLVIPNQKELLMKDIEEIKGIIITKKPLSYSYKAEIAIFEKSLEEVINEKEAEAYSFSNNFENNNNKEILFYKTKRKDSIFYSVEEVLKNNMKLDKFKGIFIGEKGLLKKIEQKSFIENKLTHFEIEDLKKRFSINIINY